MRRGCISSYPFIHSPPLSFVQHSTCRSILTDFSLILADCNPAFKKKILKLLYKGESGNCLITAHNCPAFVSSWPMILSLRYSPSKGMLFHVPGKSLLHEFMSRHLTKFLPILDQSSLVILFLTSFPSVFLPLFLHSHHPALPLSDTTPSLCHSPDRRPRHIRT